MQPFSKVRNFFYISVDRRGESEESGDDETRRKSINGDVDPNQPTSTSESSLAPTCSAETDLFDVSESHNGINVR